MIRWASICLGLFLILSVHSPGIAERQEAAPKTAIPVKALKVGRTDKSVITGMGSLSCKNAVDLGFDVPGIIAEILVKEGDRVNDGQLLVRLDQRTVDAEIAVEKAAVIAAQAEFNFQSSEYLKKEELFQKDAISDSELQKAVFERERSVASIQSAKRKVEAAETKKAKMSLFSPASGIISKIYIKAGEVVNYNTYRILRLIECQEADAEIELGERTYSLVGLNQQVNLTVDALPGRRFVGVIYYISPEINPKNRTFSIRARVNNSDMILRPGMFVRGEIDVQRGGGPIIIPDSALLPKKGDSDGVYVVKDGVAIRRQVKIGRREMGRAHVLEGLGLGDVVVVDGLDKISDLSDVTVTLMEDPRAGGEQ